MDKKKTILKVLVGSRAHGLANEKSDADYRAVYVLPTSDILSMGFKYKGNDWIEGEEDNTSYELGHFLHLAMKCNPTILEVFKAPTVEMDEDGEWLRKMFGWVWNPNDAYNAFVGYGLNQRKKFLDKKDNRQDKYACAYIRTLWNLNELLFTGSFNVEIKVPELKEQLLKYKRGDYKVGEVIDHAEELTDSANKLLAHCKHEPIPQAINSFLLDMRKKYWHIEKELVR